jgi:hypothetical protein
MKSFGKIAILFRLLGGVMAYFIIPVQFTRSRALSPTDIKESAESRTLNLHFGGAMHIFPRCGTGRLGQLSAPTS